MSNKYYGSFPNPPARTTLGAGAGRIAAGVTASRMPMAEKRRLASSRREALQSPAFSRATLRFGQGDQLPSGGHPAAFEEQVRQCMRTSGRR
jgi:hypothetical protein